MQGEAGRDGREGGQEGWGGRRRGRGGVRADSRTSYKREMRRGKVGGKEEKHGTDKS